MKVNNILCSELTQLAINKEYNKIWEHPKMQMVINTTINKVLGNAKKIDRNVTLDDITSGVYVRLADLIDRYSPVLKDGSYIEFFPYIYKFFNTYSFNVPYFTNIVQGAEFKGWKNGGNAEKHRIFYMASEMNTCYNETDESYMDRLAGEDINSDDPIKNLLSEEINKEINKMTKKGQKVMRAILSTETFAKASEITGIHISGELYDVKKYLSRKGTKKIRYKKTDLQKDLEAYKKILKLMLIKNDIDADKYAHMLD